MLNTLTNQTLTKYNKYAIYLYIGHFMFNSAINI